MKPKVPRAQAPASRTPAQIIPPRNPAPQGTADDVLAGSMELTQIEQELGLRDPQIADDTLANARVKEEVRSSAQSAVNALNEPAAQAVQKATGVDTAQTQADLDRQEVCLDILGELRHLRAGARAGKQIIDAARVLARRLTRQRVNFLLSPAGGLTPEQRQALDEDMQKVRDLEGKPVAKALQTKALKAGLTEQTLADTGNYEDQRHLLQVMGAIAQGQQVDWADLLKAAETYQVLVPEEGGDGGTAAAPPAATGTPAPGKPAKPPKPPKAKPGTGHTGTGKGKGKKPPVQAGPPNTVVGPGVHGPTSDRRGGGR